MNVTCSGALESHDVKPFPLLPVPQLHCAQNRTKKKKIFLPGVDFSVRFAVLLCHVTQPGYESMRSSRFQILNLQYWKRPKGVIITQIDYVRMITIVL